MKQTLIKIIDEFYIIDDSEIQEDDWFVCLTNNCIFNAHTIEYLQDYNQLEDSNHNFYVNSKFAKHITHSTQDLKGVIKLNKSEILEKQSNGDSWDKIYDQYCLECLNSDGDYSISLIEWLKQNIDSNNKITFNS